MSDETEREDGAPPGVLEQERRRQGALAEAGGTDPAAESARQHAERMKKPAYEVVREGVWR